MILQRSITSIHCDNYTLRVHILPDKALQTQKLPSALYQKLVDNSQKEGMTLYEVSAIYRICECSGHKDKKDLWSTL